MATQRIVNQGAYIGRIARRPVVTGGSSGMSVIGGMVLALSLPIVATGSGPGTGSGIPMGQKFLFHVARENHAWGREIQGWYVDRQGRIYEYDHSHADWRPASSNEYSEAELSALFFKKHLRTTVDAATLLRMYKLIDAAGAEGLTPRISRCRDAGIVSYVAYSYNPQSRRYKPTLLYQVGDFAQDNLSEHARTLYWWLFSLSGGPPKSCTP